MWDGPSVEHRHGSVSRLSIKNVGIVLVDVVSCRSVRLGG